MSEVHDQTKANETENDVSVTEDYVGENDVTEDYIAERDVVMEEPMPCVCVYDIKEIEPVVTTPIVATPVATPVVATISSEREVTNQYDLVNLLGQIQRQAQIINHLIEENQIRQDELFMVQEELFKVTFILVAICVVFCYCCCCCC